MKIYKIYDNWYCAYAKIKGRIMVGFGVTHYKAIVDALQS